MKKKRAGRNTKLVVTDDISHTNLSEEEYKIMEKYYEDEERVNKNDERLK
ncbi:hypothetical protein ACQUWN_23050 [Rossellomorea aquimaris]|nr:hypothetical protein [Rossellomorea vietnamensis]